MSKLHSSQVAEFDKVCTQFEEKLPYTYLGSEERLRLRRTELLRTVHNSREKLAASVSKIGMCIAVFFLELCVESQYVGVLCKPYKYTASFSLELCSPQQLCPSQSQAFFTT